jgi:hypothetical protein
MFVRSNNERQEKMNAFETPFLVLFSVDHKTMVTFAEVTINQFVASYFSYNENGQFNIEPFCVNQRLKNEPMTEFVKRAMNAANAVNNKG